MGENTCHGESWHISIRDVRKNPAQDLGGWRGSKEEEHCFRLDAFREQDNSMIGSLNNLT